VPQSRHRKINKRKKQRDQRARGSRGPSLTSNRNVKIGAIILVVVIAVSAIAYLIASRKTATAAEVTTPSGLKYTDERVGDGPSPKPGQTVTVNYVGVTQSTGAEFDNSYKKGGPVDFTLGAGLIQGWQEGLSTMKVGGKRKLIIPSELGYGTRGKGPLIPPNSTLEFDIELLDIK
jgi:peptidylprolyl isomerase